MNGNQEAQNTGDNKNRSKLDWLRTIEYKDLLSGDLAMVHEWCGEDILISLLENFCSMNLYISGRPLDLARRRFIKKYSGEKNVKEMCRLLGCSERFYYEALAESNKTEGQEELF